MMLTSLASAQQLQQLQQMQQQQQQQQQQADLGKLNIDPAAVAAAAAASSASWTTRHFIGAELGSIGYDQPSPEQMIQHKMLNQSRHLVPQSMTATRDNSANGLLRNFASHYA
ncbi:hypothetical protein BGW39_000071 [Mortierella sp. 14UC]|nr:hypothetical protein BGW39_000071 [Mortierella sp. 14UC]